MATPFDYISAFQQQGGGPFGSVMQGLQAGAQMAEMDQRRAVLAAQAEAARQKAAAEQAALERQRQQQAVVSRLIGKVRDGTWTSADFMEAQAFAPKDQAEALNKVSTSLSAESRRGMLNFGAQVFTAAALNPAVAKDLVRERAIAERNTGRPDMAKSYEDWARIIDLAPPENVQTSIARLMAGMEGGKETLDAIKAAEEEQRARALFGPGLAKAEADAETAKAAAIKAGVDAQFAPAVAQAGLTKAQSDAITAASNARFADALNQAGLNERNWNVRNVQNQIGVRSRQLQLDETKTAADVQLTLARVAEVATSLPEQAKKDINTAAVTAGTAKQQAAQFNSLADRLEKEGGGYGALSRFSEWAAKNTGREDYITSLRQEFTRLRNSAAVQSLPPGPATDRDIALVLEGFPASTADTRIMASFLRGMAKLQDITSATENARVDWLSQNRGSLGRARESFKAGDFTARPGETWVDLSQRIAADIANRYAGGGAPGAQIPTTMQPPATPALTTVTPGLPTTPGMPAGFRLLPPGR